jgi:hypothetical protein
MRNRIKPGIVAAVFASLLIGSQPPEAMRRRRVMRLATQRAVMACFCVAAPAAIGCGDGSVNPVSPTARPAVSSLAAARSGTVAAPVSAPFPRSGDLHVTKECSSPGYTGQAGDFCTITSSNVHAIEVGSRVVYGQAADFVSIPPSLDSDVVLDVPGPGNNTALGRCRLNFATGSGRCTFSGGTGKFTNFHASVDVSPPTDGVNWHWTGTYGFDPRD